MAAFVLRVAPPVTSSSLLNIRRSETETSSCPSICVSPSSSSSSSSSQFPSLSFSVTQQRSHRGCVVVAALPAYLKAKISYSHVVYVCEISINTTKESLKAAFQKCGEIVDVNLVMNKSKNMPRGYGFIYYSSDEEAKKAIEEMDGQILDGKPIKVAAVEDYKPVKVAAVVDNTPFEGFEVAANIDDSTLDEEDS